MTAFATRRGLTLLYEPEPLDEWIGRDIQQQSNRHYQDMVTGGVLTTAKAKAYRTFQARQTQRAQCSGRMADKLVCIVDKYLPLQAEETRIYVGRFPHHAKKLLRQARQTCSQKTAGKPGGKPCSHCRATDSNFSRGNPHYYHQDTDNNTEETRDAREHHVTNASTGATVDSPPD